MGQSLPRMHPSEKAMIAEVNSRVHEDKWEDHQFFEDVGGITAWKQLWDSLKNKKIRKAHLIPAPSPALLQQEEMERLTGLSTEQQCPMM